MKKRILNAILASLIIVLVMASPILAYTYKINIGVAESSGNSYTNYPLVSSFNNTYLAANNYISASGLDTRVSLGTSDLPHMLANDKTLFVAPSIGAYSNVNYAYSFGNSPLTNYSTVLGNGGFLTVSGNPALEPTNKFSIEQSGYVNTATVTTTNVYPVIESSNTSTVNASGTSHTIKMPPGLEGGDLVIIVFAASGSSGGITATGWTQILNATNLNIFFKIATGYEGPTVTFTSVNSLYSAHITYRIAAGTYSGTPTIPSIATGSSANPAPPSATALWGIQNSLWIPVVGYTNASQYNITAYPSGYTLNQTAIVTTAGYVGAGGAGKQANAASASPGTFTLSGSASYGSETIIVEPNLRNVLVSKDNAFVTYVSATNTITSAIYSSDINNAGTNSGALYAGSTVREGVRINSFSAGNIYSVSMWLWKVGSPTGTVYIRARAVTDDSILGTIASFDPSALPSATANVMQFTFNVTPIVVSAGQDIRIMIEYYGGDVSNAVGLYWSSGAAAANHFITTYNGSTYTDSGATSFRYIVYYSPCMATAAGISPGTLVVKTTADTTNLKIYVTDMVTPKATTALGGANIPINSNDWLVMSAQAPYTTYYKYSANWPILAAQTIGVDDIIDTTSHPVTLPLAATGDILLVVFSTHGNPTVTDGSGLWTKLGQASNSTTLTQAVFYKTATGSDTLTLTTSASEQGSYEAYRIINGGTPTGTSANAASGNANPPSHTPGTTDNFLWIATRSAIGSSLPTAAPTNYIGLTTILGATSSGATTSSAKRWLYGSVEDPGTFINPSAAWVSYTLAIPPVALLQSVYLQPNTVVLGGTYCTGTATFTQTSNVVLGIGTSWTSALVGSMIKFNTDTLGTWYNVATVTDTTHLTLNVAYSGTDGTGAYYMTSRMINRAITPNGVLDAPIWWGTNPSGVALTISSAESSEQPNVVPPSTEQQQQSIAPVIAKSMFGMTAPTNFLSPAAVFVAAWTTIPEVVLWIMFGLICTIGAMGGGYLLFQDEKIMFIAGGFVMGCCVVAGFLPWWCLAFLVVDAIGLIIMWRTSPG